MIIRRIVENLRARNLSVAAVELFVVVVGVFIGIQVSNWNDARIDQSHARSYLERIRADLDADIASYRDRLGFWGHVSEYGAQGKISERERELLNRLRDALGISISDANAIEGEPQN